MRRFILTLIAALIAHAASAADKPPLVFAASSLAPVLQAAAQQFEHQTGQRLRLSFGSSSSLVRQMQQGAPADMLMLAHPQWMDAAADNGIVSKDSRRVFARNTLVVAERMPCMFTHRSWTEALAGQKVITGDPDHVPLGIYAKAALQAADLWPQVRDNLLPAENARLAVTWLKQGAASVAILYGSDVSQEPGLQKIAAVPSALHPPINYEVALAPQASDTARAFATFLTRDAAQALLKEHGFLPARQETDHAAQP